MQNKRLMFVVAISLSIIFSLFYLLVFRFYIPSSTSATQTLYMNQVGLYKEEANAQKVLGQLQAESLEAYIYKNEEVYVIVSGVSETEKETKTNGEKLSALSYSYLLKKVNIQDDEISELVSKKEFQKALEMIVNKS